MQAVGEIEALAIRVLGTPANQSIEACPDVLQTLALAIPVEDDEGPEIWDVPRPWGWSAGCGCGPEIAGTIVVQRRGDGVVWLLRITASATAESSDDTVISVVIRRTTEEMMEERDYGDLFVADADVLLDDERELVEREIDRALEERPIPPEHLPHSREWWHRLTEAP